MPRPAAEQEAVLSGRLSAQDIYQNARYDAGYRMGWRDAHLKSRPSRRRVRKKYEEYAIGYGGQTYNYVLGPFDAGDTSIRLIADLDGDVLPDFVIDVDGATYLLLSTRALPGSNLPTAELLARGEDGC